MEGFIFIPTRGTRETLAARRTREITVPLEPRLSFQRLLFLGYSSLIPQLTDCRANCQLIRANFVRTRDPHCRRRLWFPLLFPKRFSRRFKIRTEYRFTHRVLDTRDNFVTGAAG